MSNETEPSNETSGPTSKAVPSNPPPAAPTTPIRIRLDTPGVIAVGPYKAGKIYDIDDPLEAQRLIEHKGFTLIS
jgi:hypothetical protein